MHGNVRSHAFVFLILWQGRLSQVCENGKWAVQHPDKSKYARVPVEAFAGNVTLAEQSFMGLRCPYQPIGHSCYLRDSARARTIEERIWISTDERCNLLTPRDYLETLRNKTLLLYGDSMAIQIFSTLMCTLNHFLHSDLIWNKFSPYLEGGQISFPDTTTTIAIRYDTKFDVEHISTTFADMRLTTRDIFIFNIGLHYNDKSAYESVLRKALDTISTVNRTRSLPKMFFLQTTPQHFATDNGYFNPQLSSKNCTIKSSPGQMKNGDWRNIALDNTISKWRDFGSIRNAHVIRIANALYSQYDAHIDRNGSDCTHFCIPSAVFPFIHRTLFNDIRQYQS